MNDKSVIKYFAHNLICTEKQTCQTCNACGWKEAKATGKHILNRDFFWGVNFLYVLVTYHISNKKFHYSCMGPDLLELSILKITGKERELLQVS